MYTRTLNDITPPSRRREPENLADAVMPPSGRDRTPLRLTERPPRLPYTTIVVSLVVIGASIGALFYFSAAKVEVTPTITSANVQSSFTAVQSTGALPYEIITTQKVATQGVKGSGTKAVTASASGMLTIYNTQTKAQQLRANTRFATNSGLIFRIKNAVTVPGGSVSKPGTLSVRVYADQPGASYNIPPSTFTIPGFAGTPQATAVTAKSTAAFTGGSSGTEPVVDATLDAQTRVALIQALSGDLSAAIKAQIPPGYVLLEGAATTTYVSLASAASAATGMVDVKEQGTVTAVVFPADALGKAVASSILGLGYQGSSITLLPNSSIRLTAPNLPEPNAPSFSFALSGTASLQYTVDPSVIAAAVAGKTRSEAEVILTNYPEVKRAILTLRPFWRKNFPQDPASITVTVANP